MGQREGVIVAVRMMGSSSSSSDGDTADASDGRRNHSDIEMDNDNGWRDDGEEVRVSNKVIDDKKEKGADSGGGVVSDKGMNDKEEKGADSGGVDSDMGIEEEKGADSGGGGG